MPVINLMPPPAFDHSLVPAFSTNFNRIRNALARTSNIYLWNIGGTGPFPVSTTVAVPFKANILSVASATCYATIGPGVCGVQVVFDGTPLPHLMDMYFNELSSHRSVNCSNYQTGITPGNHNYSFLTTDSSAHAESDSNDRWRMAFTMIEVF